jgi:hypothetical protein
MNVRGETVRLDGRAMTIEVDTATGRWALADKRSGVRWPSKGTAGAGTARGLQGGFAEADRSDPRRLCLRKKNGAAVAFELSDRW